MGQLGGHALHARVFALPGGQEVGLEGSRTGGHHVVQQVADRVRAAEVVVLRAGVGLQGQLLEELGHLGEGLAGLQSGGVVLALVQIPTVAHEGLAIPGFDVAAPVACAAEALDVRVG